MRLALTDEQEALRDTLRLLLSRESGSAAVRSAAASPDGFDRALWTRLCAEVGIAGLLIPEPYGGLGATLADLHVALAELGRTLTPSPMLGSAVLAAQAILATGNFDACHRLLPGIAAGTTIAALAWVTADGHWDPTSLAFSHPPLTGQAHYVLDGTTADILIAVARTADGPTLFEVDPTQPGVRRVPSPTMDPTRTLATIHLTGVVGHALGPANLAHVRDIALTALAAEQSGTACRCLELTVEHTQNRIQFGRPIATFQALKHRMADMHVLVETAESAALAAAVTDADNLPLAAAVAKTWCSEALCSVASEMIQLHGGIAITWEHDAQLYFKRAHGSAQLFGSPGEHVARVGVLAQ